MTGRQEPATARLLICSSCAGTENSRFTDDVAVALAAAGLDGAIEIRPVECMSACASPIAIALQGEGMASYVFSGLQLGGDIHDIVATCRVYLDSPQGEITDARPCGRLRNLLRARLPAFT